MNNKNSLLTENHQRLFRTFLAQAGESALDKKFELIRHGNRKYARLNETEISMNLSDQEITALARLGYLQIYTNPPAIVFTPKILTELKKLDNQIKPASSPNLKPSSQILKMDIIQVYAWLITSLIAAIFSLYLLWTTIQFALNNNVSESVFTGVITAVSGLLSAVFFRNYDKANGYLKHLRSLPNDTDEGDSQ
jgi:hypothetical protein